MTPSLSKEQKVGISLLVLSMCEKKRKKREMWAKRLYLERPLFNDVRMLEILNSADFKNFLRMTPVVFYELLAMVKPLIQKKSTNMREAVSAEERLIITLRYLATGRSYNDLKFSAAVSPALISKIVPETCEAIYSCLRKGIKMPSTEEQWYQVADGFEKKWNFPNCLGALDGKHVAIDKPKGSGSLYFNYKKFFSVILFAMVDADYRFMFVHVGTNGSASDATVFDNTKLHEKLMNGTLQIPPPSTLPGSNKKAPYVFLGDKGFGINKHFMTPFSLRNINHRQRIFNYRLSRARRVVENAFGHLAARFRVLRQSISTKLETTDIIILTCCALHNFLITKNPSYIGGQLVQQGESRSETTMAPMFQFNARQRNEEGNKIREIFVQYVNDEGSVPFQEDMIVSLNPK